jgi:hypothetical protein
LMNVATNAVARGMNVAVIDRGPLGGTCLNRGCIPSKVMLYPADVIRMAEEAKAIGVHEPYAAILVQQLVYLMNTEEQDYTPLALAQTIHPALSEVVVGAFGNLRPVGEHVHEHVH